MIWCASPAGGGRLFQLLRKICDMTSYRRAGIGRTLWLFGVAGLLALTSCDKGPDREKIAADLKSGVEDQLKKMEGSSAQKVVSHSAVNVTPQDSDTYLVSIEGLLVLAGGVPVKAGEETIGGIGVGGAPSGDIDDECARAGIEAVGAKLK